MKDLLLEIGTEEIPAGFMPPALKELKANAEKMFNEERIAFEDIKTLGTPRRIVLLVRGLAEKQSDLEELVKGPSTKIAYDQDKNPTKAALGFARGQGVDVEKLEVKEVDGVDYIFAQKKLSGVETKSLLSEILEKLILGLHFKKPMRWADYEMRYARPIRWILPLFGEEIIPISLEMVESANTTRGHRFLGKENVEVASVEDYFEKMKENFVIVDQDERKAMIQAQMKQIELDNDCKIDDDAELLEEVVYLLEYPTALMGDFEEKVLELPKEAIITPMKEHQRYFPVFDQDGKLLNHFVTVRNGNSEHLETVKEGNERVLVARLKDAEFFYEEDKKNHLENNLERLKTIVFQDELGTIYEKTERIIKNSEKIAGLIDLDSKEIELTKRAALLAKTDLVTNMVYEFPELQGIMGEKYALIFGEEELVAKGIFEHYLPRNAEDELPQTKQGMITSISDKIDTIVGCFAIGIEPTGSQDPYALRRQAQGISKILIDNELDVSFEDLVDLGIEGYKGKVQVSDEIREKILAFFNLRMKNILTEMDFSYDIVDSVLEVEYSNLSDVVKKAEALKAIKGSKEFDSLLAGFVRANNIAKKTEEDSVDESILEDSNEKALFEKFQEVAENFNKAAAEKDYHQALVEMASLEGVINNFFDNVMVMVEDEKVKNNRLGLIKQISKLPRAIADLTKIIVA